MTREELKAKITRCIEGITTETLTSVMKEFTVRLERCVTAEGKHVEI